MMIFVNLIILLYSLTLILVEGIYNEKPSMKMFCKEDGISVEFYFEEPFGGTIFAQGYFSNPICSSPNLPNISTSKIYLSLPLFSCGTQLHRRKNRDPVLRNTVKIQYHPMMKTIYDRTENVFCKYIWPVPRHVGTLNQQKEWNIPVMPYRSWIGFKLGNEVMGETEAKQKGVTYNLFLVAYVQDGGRNKDLKVGKCFAHDEHILTENTTVFEMNPEGSCSDSHSLSEFTVIRPYLPVSDLMAYAEVKSFNIRTKGDLFVTCGMQICENACFQGCPEHYRHEINHWSTVTTHRLTKRSLDKRNSGEQRKLENSNIFLKSTIKALAKKLQEYKTELNSRRNGFNFNRRASKLLSPDGNSIQLSDHDNEPGPEQDFNQDNETTTFTSTEEQTLTEQSYAVLTNVDEEVVVVNRAFNSLVSEIDVEEPLTVNDDKELTTNMAFQNTTVFLPALYTDYFMTTGLPIYNRSTATYEPRTVYIITSDDPLKQDKTSGNVSNEMNATNTNEELHINSAIVQDCVPNFKFLVVTTSLSILSFSFFVLCVGMWLYIRKERKRTSLNSYLLYSFY